MQLIEAIRERKSVRAFLDKAVEQEKIERILESARFAPSGVNTQPWEVAVVSGETKKAIEKKILEKFTRGEKETPDYVYYPETWFEPFKSRRISTGLLLYKTLGIKREEKERMQEQWARNYRAFDAPVVLYFLLKKGMGIGSFLDYGMFVQNVALLAQSEGLGSCIQAAFVDYAPTIREALGYDDHLLVCGMALGYEDTNHIVNTYRTDREHAASFTRYFS